MTFEQWWKREAPNRADEPELALDAWEAGKTAGLKDAIQMVANAFGVGSGICNDLRILLPEPRDISES